MKVYYISGGYDTCYAVRCILPLSANGWDGDKVSIGGEEKEARIKSQAVQDADIIVFHRPDKKGKLELARMLKSMGKKIVMDNDDTYLDDAGIKINDFMNKERVKLGMNKINDSLYQFAKEADMVTVSTEYLRDEYLKLNENVITLPNCVDPFYFDTPKRNKGEKVRIGIVGSIAYTTDMDVAMPIVKHYQGDERVEFVLFSLPAKGEDTMVRSIYKDEHEFWDSMKLEWHPFVPMEDYYDKLNDLKLDLMIIPRADNYFNRCKSNIKFLEASMFEIPVIASGFIDGKSPYQGDDEKYMRIVIDNNDWIGCIEAYINNKDVRRAMGKRAKEYVLENYDIEKTKYQWVNSYKTLL